MRLGCCGQALMDAAVQSLRLINDNKLIRAKNHGLDPIIMTVDAEAGKLTAEEITAITRQTNYGTWRYQKGWQPLYIADAEGCWIIDGAGKRYLDLSAQLMCVNLGHKNPRVVEAIAEQARELCYVAPSHTTRSRARLSEKLLEVLPEGLNKFFLAPSGTEANEAAFKIARLVTGKNKIIARYRSFHGSTAGSIGATGDLRRWPAEPAGKAPGFVFAPETNCYNCPIGHTYPGCNIACADYIEHMIRNESDVAAIILEPVVGTNGVLVPPPEYFQRLRRICDDHGVLMIDDEVMAGWGRTGKWFAIEHWGVQPDILTTAKGITSAYVPLGLCATTAKVAEYFEDHYFAHGHTYEAHPLALGPAVATIEEMQRLKLPERAAELEPYVRQKLEALKARHPSVGDVRGLGLFFAVEIVKNRATKEPFNEMRDKVEGKPLLVDRIAAKMMEQGVSIQTWVSHFIIAPPLIVTREELDFGIAALDEHLSIADALVEA
jgi:taurine--2-oxoglutarate transaminase